MVSKFKDLLDSVQKNSVFAVAIGLTAVTHLISEIAAPIKSLVIQDLTIVLLASVVVYLVTVKFTLVFRAEAKFAQEKLRVNKFVYAIRESRYLLFGVLAIYTVFFALYGGRISILVDHAKPPYNSNSYCIRVPSDCRKCIQFLDSLGRASELQKCLKTDIGGLLQHSLDRWKGYKPQSVSLVCKNNVEILPIRPSIEDAKCSTLLQ